MKKGILLFGALSSCFLLLSIPVLPAVQFNQMENARQKERDNLIQLLQNNLVDDTKNRDLIYENWSYGKLPALNNLCFEQSFDTDTKILLEDVDLIEFLFYNWPIILILWKFIGLIVIKTPLVDEDGAFSGGMDDKQDWDCLTTAIVTIIAGYWFLWGLNFVLPDIFIADYLFPLPSIIIEYIQHFIKYGNPLSIILSLIFIINQIESIIENAQIPLVTIRNILDAFDIIDYDQDGY